MLDHPIFVFFAYYLTEKLIEWGARFLSKQYFFVKKKPEVEIVEELSPLRNEIVENEKKADILREELLNLNKEAEKINTPKTFALYSKIQRKANAIKEKLEEMENNLVKMKRENDSLKNEKNKDKNKAIPEDLSFINLDNNKKLQIATFILKMVLSFKNKD